MSGDIILLTEDTELDLLVETYSPIVLEIDRASGSSSAATNVVKLTAATNLNALRVIATDSDGKAIFADSSAPSVLSVIGVNPNAALIDETVSVQTFGELSDVSFSWMPGAPLFLTTDGVVSETAPTTGFILQIGFAETATKIFINIGEPSIL